jgi:2-polyprenyl-6-methoxyphenol hydroxylase-like FAD-dependent oxidoreductase
MAAQEFSVQCCIAGGGPAGLMAGLLFARAGVEVLVVEKHADFLRDFRGDTIHPSTLDVLHDLRLAEPLLKLPHQKVRKLQFHAGGATYPIAEFGELPLRYPFVAMMPQWDFLNFLAREAARSVPFNLIMEAEAKSVIEADGRIAGLRIDTAGGPIEVRADLTIAADGRRSILREQAGLAVAEVGAPMDVLWFRLVREQTDPEDVAGFLGAGEALIAISRGDYWQCGLIIPKGAFGAIQTAGIEAFRAEIEAMAPPLRGRMAAVADWNDVKLLTVAVDRLVQWYRPGFLCIGDAAHAMSPIGGVGINLAIQDAVAASNLCAIPLREGRLTVEQLRSVQHRRELPARLIQLLQVFIQRRVLRPILRADKDVRVPLPIQIAARLPWLRRKLAATIGVGLRPERVETRPRRPPGM